MFDEHVVIRRKDIGLPWQKNVLPCKKHRIDSGKKLAIAIGNRLHGGVGARNYLGVDSTYLADEVQALSVGLDVVACRK
jgi:hypothetical protein